MAGLLDWLTDGSLGTNFGGATPAPPPVQMTGTDVPQPPFPQGGDPVAGSGAPPFPQGTDPMTAGLKPPTPDPLPTQPMPPMQQTGADQPMFPQGGDPMQPTGGAPGNGLPLPQGGDPMVGTGSGNNGGLASAIGSPVPMPAPRPAAAVPGAIPPPPPEQPPGAPANILPPGGAVPAVGDRGTFMDRFKKTLGDGLGAGLTAAGNSAGKSPFQALAAGGGATLTGAQEEKHKDTKDAQGYLTAAIAAKRANDEAGYKTNYTQYLAAKLKADQEKTASKDAANKNDSPTQLVLRANSEVSKDKEVAGSLKVLEGAIRTGTPDDVAKAQTAHAALIAQKKAALYAQLGITPQAAAQLEKQPGMSAANPIDGKKAGLTPESIKKLQPGQYYTNPADGKLYQFKGAPGTAKKGADTKPEPMNPTRTLEDAE